MARLEDTGHPELRCEQVLVRLRVGSDRALHQPVEQQAARAATAAVEAEYELVVALVVGLGGFWLLLITLVGREKGWVGISDLARVRIRLRVAFYLMSRQIGERLTPTIRKTNRELVRLNKQLAEAFRR